ncbi:coiled-coil domain-containing protein [Streptomyces sp. NPDC007988]|uniref:coiled-coil domain-containing protein n=1 Tax=Streptomyces sp. NPDC007988 TaxID=3364802 RepID=UPI0036E2331E
MLRTLRATALVAAALGATAAGPAASGKPPAGSAAVAPAAAPGPSAGPGREQGDGGTESGPVPLPGSPGKPAAAPGEPAGAPRRPAAAPGRPAIGPVVGAVPARVSRALTRLQGLFRQAAEASEAYSASREMLVDQAAETKRLNTALADARGALSRSRDEAGRLARRQYQGRSELSPYLRLLLARDPRSALEQSRLLERAADSSRATIARLENRARRADALAAASRRAFDEQRALAERQREQRDTLRDRLNDVEEVLASLSPEELSTLGTLGTVSTPGTVNRTDPAPAPATPPPPSPNTSPNTSPYASPRASAPSSGQAPPARSPRPIAPSSPAPARSTAGDGLVGRRATS